MGLGTKILKIGPKLRELAIVIKILNADTISGLSNSWMGMCNGDFDCQGHNSLNFGPILKILVPKPISFPRPFFLIL